jgi:hypothetical protein
VARSFIASGLRVFDIRDRHAPREVAFFVAPPASSPVVGERTNYAMSKPVFDSTRRHAWYTDGSSGLYAVRLTRLSRRFRRAKVTVDGRRVRVRRRSGRLRARVSLRGKQAGELATVRIVGRTRAGERVVRTWLFRACAPR